jgi:NAD-dependent dihydropyrimidine dehydrogenase PreA subunit
MSTTVTRQIVRIDEELCNGCGVCVSPCAEGAIVIVDGKAKVVREELCDGAGFCLGVCPTGALTLETREAVPFDHHAVEEHVSEQVRPPAVGAPYIAQSLLQLRHERGRPPAAARAYAGHEHVGVHALSAGLDPRLGLRWAAGLSGAPRPPRCDKQSDHP